MVTITDIAKKCGVSVATVSLVLSDHPRISKQTKQKVLRVIKQLKYYPNIAARMLSTNKTNTICIVVPQISHIFLDPFFSEVLNGIYDVAVKNDFRLLLEVATYEFCFYKRYLRLFKERMIDGMLYIGSTLNDKYLIDLEKEKLPVVLAGSYFPEGKGPQLSYVIGDNKKGGYLATKHLIKLGHKRIALITGNFRIISAYDRYLGYKQALQEAGIKFDRDLVVKADFDEQTGYRAMKKLLMLKNKPTAVFAGNDMMAVGAIKAITDSGLKVPDDIAVVGMDNVKFLLSTGTRLTTVDYNMYKIGVVSCEKLIQMLKKQTVEYTGTVLPVKLIIRDTCGANQKSYLEKE